jgi:hypothetical protein
MLLKSSCQFSVVRPFAPFAVDRAPQEKSSSEGGKLSEEAAAGEHGQIQFSCGF